MYAQQTTRNRPAWAKRGPAGRSDMPGGTIPQMAMNQRTAKFFDPNYMVSYKNFNKMRGTPSSAARTMAPKLYL